VQSEDESEDESSEGGGPAPAPAPTKPKPKKTKTTAASTSGVKKPTKGNAAGAGKNTAKPAAGKKGATKAGPKEPVKKPTKKLPGKTKKGDQPGRSSEDEESEDDEGVPGASKQPTQPGSDNGKEGGAAPPTGGRGEGQAPQPPVTRAEAGATLLPRQLDPKAHLAPRSIVTHDPEPPESQEVRYDPPGYDGARSNLGKLVGKNWNYFSDVAFSTAPDELQYKKARWVRAGEIARGSFGKAE